MRKRIIHLLFGVSQLIFALLTGGASSFQEGKQPQKRFIVKSPAASAGGVQFRQRLLFPSNLNTVNDGVSPRKWKRVSLLIPSTTNRRLTEGSEVRRPCPRPYSHRLCSSYDIHTAHTNARSIRLNEFQERIRKEKLREFENLPNDARQEWSTDLPIRRESLEKRDYDQLPSDDDGHDSRDFSVPPRYYPEDGPKRNWRVNLMRVWGKRSLSANPFFAVNVERQQHI